MNNDKKPVGRKCPDCGGNLISRDSTKVTDTTTFGDGSKRVHNDNYPAFIGCSNYHTNGCRYTEEL